MDAARVAYKLGIRDVDDMLGEFIKKLKTLGIYDETTILFFADHGEEFYKHGLLTHSSLYLENLRIPFLLKLAKGSEFAPLAKGTEKENPYTFEGHTTIFKVILDLFDVDYPPYLAQSGNAGLSLKELSLLDKDQEAFSEYHVLPRDNFYEASLLLEGGPHVILSARLGQQQELDLEDEHLQIYDYGSDPDEPMELLDPRDPRFRLLRNRILEKAQGVRSLRFDAQVAQELGEEEREKLRALGYLN
jgi:arylsulfatase A-like enzyme